MKTPLHARRETFIRRCAACGTLAILLAAARSASGQSNLIVDPSQSNKGDYQVSQGTLTFANIYVGAGGTATMEAQNATITVNSGLYIGDYFNPSGGRGQYIMSSGNLTAATASIGVNTYGDFYQTGGLFTVGSMLLGDSHSSSANAGAGEYDLNGGTLQVGSISMTSGQQGNLYLNGGTLQAKASTTTFLQGLTSAQIQKTSTLDTQGYSVTVAQSLSGGGGLTKVGSGTLTLSNTNTYTGDTNVNAGTLVAGHTGTQAGTFAGGSNVNVNSGGTLQLTGTDSLGYYSGNANLNINGGLVTTDGGTDHTTLNNVSMTGGTLTANGPGDSSFGTYYLNGPLVTNATSTAATINSTNGGTITLGGTNNSVTFNVAQGTVSGGVDLQISATLSGSSALAKTGAGTLSLTTANTYTGGTIINAGTLIAGFQSIGVGGKGTFAAGSTVTVNSGGTLQLAGKDSLGFYSGTALGTLAINGGLVTTDGSANHTTIDTVSMTGGTLTANGPGDGTFGALYLNGPISTNASSTTATLNASNSGYVSLIGSDTGGGSVTFNVAKGTTSSGVDLLISAPLTNNTPLVKNGAGTLALSGANTYSGATSVNAGTLLAQNTSGSATGTGAVGVTGSGSLLGGTGTVSGAVTVGSGAGVLGGNGTAATGALALSGALTLNSGSFIELALGANGAHSTLARTGSGTWSFAANQAFTFVNANGGAQTGFYDNILTGLSADPGGESSWTITGTQFRGSFAYDGSGNIDLTLTAVPEPATWAAGALTVLAAAHVLRRRVRA